MCADTHERSVVCMACIDCCSKSMLPLGWVLFMRKIRTCMVRNAIASRVLCNACWNVTKLHVLLSIFPSNIPVVPTRSILFLIFHFKNRCELQKKKLLLSQFWIVGEWAQSEQLRALLIFRTKEYCDNVAIFHLIKILH